MKKLILGLLLVMGAGMAGAAQYQKVTSVEQLADGDVVLMANETAGKVSGSCAGKYLYATDATFADGKVSVDGATEIILTKSGANWTMKAGNTVLGASGTDFSTNASSTKTYTISFESNGDVNIASTNTASGKIFYNGSSPRFKLYTSNSMSPIQLYKKIENTTDTIPTDTIPTDTVPTDTVVPGPQGQMVTYRLLQNVSDLHEGDTVLFGTPAKDYVLGQYVSGSNIKGVAATYSADRHEVTANNLNAYTVIIEDGKYAFKGSDGKYLYMYNTNKNLSSTETDFTSNKAKWTVSIADDVATIKSVYSSTWAIYFNKTAATPLFCTYSSSPKYDTNLGDIVLYSNHAPAYQEKVLHPAMQVLLNGVAVGDTLDWGEVVYDDSFGTEAAPYSEYKSLNVVGTDLPRKIGIALSGSSMFSTYTDSLPATGGTLGVNFETTNEGSYEGTLTITCDTLSKTIVLKAKAVREATIDPSTLPTLYVSETAITMHVNMENSLSGITGFSFSAQNLDKKLYVKWQKNNSEPTVGRGLIEMLVGDQEIAAGETAQFDAPTVDTTEVLIDVTPYSEFSYSSSLYFYSYKAGSKTELAVEYTLPFSIQVTVLATGEKQTTIIMDGQRYNLMGQPVDETYPGIVIINGEKQLPMGR